MPWAEAACLLAGALTPLAFHTLGTVGFESTKAVLVRVLALVIALGWLSGHVASLRSAARGLGSATTSARGGTGSATGGGQGGRGWAALPNLGGPAERRVVLALVGLVLSLALSTALSVQPLVSLWGSWDRVQGLVTVASWIVLGVAAAAAGRVYEHRASLVRVWLVASAPVCLYALAQRALLDPVAWLHQPLGATSTLGSSTALATYLAMLLPLTLARAVEAGRALAAVAAPSVPAESGRRGRREREEQGILGVTEESLILAGWTGLFVLQVAALFAAQVRGGLLGAAAGLAVGVVVLVWRFRPRRRRLALGAAGVVALGAVAAILVDVLSGGAGDTNSTGQRILIWRATLDTLAGAGWRVLFGFGPETQAVALEGRFPLELAARFEDLRYDRAHNLLFDALLTTGVSGAGLLVAVLVAVVQSGARRLAALGDDGAILAAGLFGALAAYLAANSVAFDSNATGVLGSMVAGLIVAPSLPTSASARAAGSSSPAPAKGRERASEKSRARVGGLLAASPLVRLRVTAWLVTIAVGASLVPWIVAPLMADVYHTRALALRAAEAPASSTVPDMEAARWAPSQDVPLIATALAHLDGARTTTAADGPVAATYDDLATQVPTSRAAQFQAARLLLERAAEINPRDAYAHAHLARMWATWAEAAPDDATRLDRFGRAVEAYDRAIELGPSRATFYDESAETLIAWDRPDFAIARFEQAEALTRPAAGRLAAIGDVERTRGNVAEARALYERALALDDRSAPAEAGLAALERDGGNLAAAIEHAQRAARNQMRTWTYHRDLALLYRDAGQREEALGEARAARRAAPAWEWDRLGELVESLR